MICVRVSLETREALNAAAKNARRSLSREVERRLVASLAADGVHNPEIESIRGQLEALLARVDELAE